MAAIIKWKKVPIVSTNPDADYIYVGIDSADEKIYFKNSSGTIIKYQTSTDVSTAITTAINNLLDGAPAALDTLNELAAAIADDANFAASVATALSGKTDKVTTISAGAGLTGGGDLSANRTISMPNVGTPNTYGSATQSPVITTDAQGRVSSVTNTTVTPLLSSIQRSGAVSGQIAQWNGTSWVPANPSGIQLRTSAQRLAIASPTTGLQVYDTNLQCICTYNGTGWRFTTHVVSTTIFSTTNNFYNNALISPSLEAGRYKISIAAIMQSGQTFNGVGMRVNPVTATMNQAHINFIIPRTNSTDFAAADHLMHEAPLQDRTTDNVPFANQDFPVFGEGQVNLTATGTIALSIRSQDNAQSSSLRIGSIFTIERVG